ncbi:hypothetical protein [Psychrobacillus sp. FSL K6-1464]|uniref:hypothetical protein n=1 Tax=Psychrobacillus sp. FSL K6-1464 TaxID=2921545 RepID=UPI0030F89EAE
MNQVTKIGISGLVVAALPLFSKFIIRDTIPLNIQFYILFGIIFVGVSVFGGIFYLRNKDLELRIIEIKDENKKNTEKLETRYDNEIKSLKENIKELENNREGLKNIITTERQYNFALRSQLALYSFGYPAEKRLELEQAATTHLGGGIINGSESNQDH